MKIKNLLLIVLALFTSAAYAEDGGFKGTVVSRDGRTALSNVKVMVEPLGVMLTTDDHGNFNLTDLPSGDYRLKFEAPEYETLDFVVRVGKTVKDLNSVILSPDVQSIIDDSIFAEFDSDVASDAASLPSSLSSSKDVFNNIASYRFSEMRFNVRGYDSQYSSIYLNGIRFNDAMTGYGPWSLWSGLNDATRNQENTAGLRSSGFGIDGIGGTTNVNARASQVRKGFRASVVNSTQMYRARVMVSYGSGMLDNGWSYALSVSTRQGGNGYVDGVYYNAFGYFASVEKRFGRDRHSLALTVLGAPTERGAQQASTQEVYDLLYNNYYNPNIGRQNGELRNTRVRDYHEPIAMLNYSFDISKNTKLTAAASYRFGKNGYSALTWTDGPDPRPDYYRYLPSYYENRIYATDGENDPVGMGSYEDMALAVKKEWVYNPDKGLIDFDKMYQRNRLRAAQGEGGIYMIEERHTDQRDFNFAANIAHTFRDLSILRGGLAVRVNRTHYYDEVKDLLGADYWLDVDKFALRDNGTVDETVLQNDLAYYLKHGEAPRVKEGDKFNYDYYAQLRKGQLWAQYNKSVGGFSMSIGGEVGYTEMWREGLLMKGLFRNNSLGKSEKLDFVTWKAKGEFSYRFSGAHALEANVTYMADAPQFRDAFVSSRTRNTVTPGLDTEKIFGADLSYNIRLPWITARISGYYTTITDQSKVISYYDDTQSAFTNFAMSGIDKRYYGLEVGVDVPIWNGLSLRGALSLGDYSYTSNADFMQTRDNSEEMLRNEKVLWKGLKVESTPQTAINVGLNFRGPNNWFASVDFNYYDNIYLSMNPARRTTAAYQSVLRASKPENERLPMDIMAAALYKMRDQEKFDASHTLSASLGKTWYIKRLYQLGFSLEVKNILNDQDIRTGGYEQMRLSRRTYVKTLDNGGKSPIQYYTPFDSKYFYLFGTTYYLNVYFRF